MVCTQRVYKFVHKCFISEHMFSVGSMTSTGEEFEGPVERIFVFCFADQRYPKGACRLVYHGKIGCFRKS